MTKKEKEFVGLPQCFYCGKVLTNKNTTMDHKHPLSLGGANSKENKVKCCRLCNLRKGCLTYEEFRIILAFERGLVKTKLRFYGERIH